MYILINIINLNYLTKCIKGHTANNRLDVFAMKPAPIQITYLG